MEETLVDKRVVCPLGEGCTWTGPLDYLDRHCRFKHKPRVLFVYEERLVQWLKQHDDESFVSDVNADLPYPTDLTSWTPCSSLEAYLKSPFVDVRFEVVATADGDVLRVRAEVPLAAAPSAPAPAPSPAPAAPSPAPTSFTTRGGVPAFVTRGGTPRGPDPPSLLAESQQSTKPGELRTPGTPTSKPAEGAKPTEAQAPAPAPQHAEKTDEENPGREHDGAEGARAVTGGASTAPAPAPAPAAPSAPAARDEEWTVLTTGSEVVLAFALDPNPPWPDQDKWREAELPNAAAAEAPLMEITGVRSVSLPPLPLKVIGTPKEVERWLHTADPGIRRVQRAVEDVIAHCRPYLRLVISQGQQGRVARFLTTISPRDLQRTLSQQLGDSAWALPALCELMNMSDTGASAFPHFRGTLAWIVAWLRATLFANTLYLDFSPDERIAMSYILKVVRFLAGEQRGLPIPLKVMCNRTELKFPKESVAYKSQDFFSNLPGIFALANEGSADVIIQIQPGVDVVSAFASLSRMEAGVLPPLSKRVARPGVRAPHGFVTRGGATPAVPVDLLSDDGTLLPDPHAAGPAPALVTRGGGSYVTRGEPPVDHGAGGDGGRASNAELDMLEERTMKEITQLITARLAVMERLPTAWAEGIQRHWRGTVVQLSSNQLNAATVELRSVTESLVTGLLVLLRGPTADSALPQNMSTLLKELKEHFPSDDSINPFYYIQKNSSFSAHSLVGKHAATLNSTLKLLFSLYHVIDQVEAELNRPPNYRTKMCTRDTCRDKPDPSCEYAHTRNKLRLGPQAVSRLLENPHTAVKRDEECKFFALGTCLKEDKCEFRHTRAEPPRSFEPVPTPAAPALSEDSSGPTAEERRMDERFPHLQTALMKRNFAECDRLLAENPNILEHYRGERNMLLIAVRYPKFTKDAVDWLIRNGANVNSRSRDKYGLTPLMTAVYFNMEPMLIHLLGLEGVDRKLKSNENKTAEELAYEHHPTLVHWFREITPRTTPSATTAAFARPAGAPGHEARGFAFPVGPPSARSAAPAGSFGDPRISQTPPYNPFGAFNARGS